MKKSLFDQKSTSISIVTMMLAMKAAKEFSKGKLISKTKHHEKFIKLSKKMAPYLPFIEGDDGVLALASSSCKELNQALKENGFDIQLDDFEPPNYGAVGLFRIGGKLLREGTPTRIKDLKGTDHGRNSGAKFSRMFYQKENGSVAMLSRNKKYVIAFSPVDEYFEGIKLFKKSFKILKTFQDQYEGSSTVHSNTLYDNVILPCVDFDESVDIEKYLVGMGIGDGVVSQALQQNQFQFNEVAFEAASATAVTVTRGMGGEKKTNDLVLNGPMIVTVATNDPGPVNIPILSLMLCEDGWGRPS